MDLCSLVILSLIIAISNSHIVSAFTYSKINEFTGSGGWLRLCSASAGADGSNIIGTTKADKCSSGYWFKDPVKVGCACGHGVWIFSKGWCDQSTKIILAYNGSCFPIDKDVRYIRSIGYANSAYMPYHFQATSGFEYVQELPIGFDFSYFNPKYDQHLGSIFRSKQIESKNSKRCLEHEDAAKRAFALKYYAEKNPYRQSDQCFLVAGEPNPFIYDEGLDLDEYLDMKDKGSYSSKPISPSGQTVKDTAKCSTQCPANGIVHTTPKTNPVPADYFDPLIDDYYPLEHNHTNTTKVCNDKTKQYSLTNKTVLEITEQTKRMIMANVANAVKKIPAPKVEVSDYTYLQMSRKILETVCPNTEVPHVLVTGLLRMFRVAVKESLRFYPFSENPNKNHKPGILQFLKTCYEKAKDHPFTFEYKNGSKDSNNTDEQCGLSFDKVTYKYTGKNVRTLHSGIPCELETDIKQLDLPIETAWKTVMFGHYYCARHFTEKIADHDTFYAQLETFFNRWIQHRWFYPGKSFKAYEFVFPNYDLKKFALNLDRCVAASRSFSNFRKWIKRPVYVKNCGGSLFQDTREEQFSKKNSNPDLDAIAPALTEFGKTAYCLPYWHTPASNPGINYDPSSDVSDGCVNYDRDEWTDDVTPGIDTDWSN